MTAARLRTNFDHLAAYDERLLRLGLVAERSLADDPNTCLLKLRQLGILMAPQVAGRSGQTGQSGETQYELLRRLLEVGVPVRRIFLLYSRGACRVSLYSQRTLFAKLDFGFTSLDTTRTEPLPRVDASPGKSEAR